MNNKRYKLEVSSEQLKIIIDCVEDCHRFLCGQMELSNTTQVLDERIKMRESLSKLKYLVTPYQDDIEYDWSGHDCPNKSQKKLIGATYYLYREIQHLWTLLQNSKDWNVYKSPTLRCENSGEPIKLDEI